MGRQKSGPGKSFRPSPKRRPKENVGHIHKLALSTPEGLPGKRQYKGTSEPSEQSPAVTSGPPERSPSKPFPVVGVGASAGGLEAFTSFLKALPADTGMAFVLVQHMDPAHESLLNRLLAKDTVMPVIQVKDGMTVERNCVYVIPPNTKMTIQDGNLRLVVRPGGESRYTPIDSFLSALAEDQQGMAIGVILSGIGSDGTKGLLSIKAEGGITFAQDEDSAKFPGMPQSAVAAGCVDLVLSPDKIARELARMRRHPYLEIARSPSTAELPSEEGGRLRRLFQLIRSFTGVDFTHYKQTTILRRVSRRMLVRRSETLAQYVKYVEDHPDEVRALFQDLLIHVTSFFRESAVFQALQGQVFPRITASLTSGESIRIWIPGCSTGEEVYSLAIAWYEYFGEAAAQTEIKIFGTDLSDLNVQKARAAVYLEASMEGVSPERLRRYFVKTERGYQVAKRIREMCIFARHDLTKDPPFARMDMISCQNVLIYLTQVLQRRVLNFIHYALKPAGLLILGKSESPSAVANLFSLEYRKANIYSKVPAPARALPEFQASAYERVAPTLPLPAPPAPPVDLRKEAERIILERYAPAGLVVDAGFHILNFLGDTSPFLQPAPGEASLDLLKLVRQELILEVGAAIQEAKKLRTAARREGVPFKRGSRNYRTDLEVVPIPGRSPRGVDFLVLFRNLLPQHPGKLRPLQKSSRGSEAKQIERLEQDLASSQEHLRSILEDQEGTSEELRAANEEVLSSNEELQSTNEELQTAQEEVQSANEELTTVNEELRDRNLDLTQTANDLTGVLNAVEIPILILGNDRRIRRFTPAAGKLLNLISTDVGRPISQIRPNVEIPDLAELVSEVIENKRSVEREVCDERGHWYAFRMLPHQLKENKIEAILTVVDINDIKQSSTAVLETMRGSLLVLDSQFHIASANRAFYAKFQLKREEVENHLLFELGQGQWNIPRLRELLEKVLPEKREVVDFELEHDFPAIGHKIMLINARQLYLAGIGSQKILLAIADITERKAADEKIHQLLARLMTAREEEGKRIARELHDSLGPLLGTINLKVSEVAGRLSSQPDLGKQLEEIRNEVSNAGKVAHNISHELHPAALLQLGLVAALESECAAFSKLYGTAINFSAESVPESLPDPVALCLFRVALAGLENIRQHAQAKTASVRLVGRNSEMGMVIQDFGRGFDPSAARSGHGLGLVSMKERVRLVKGKLSVNSKPGEGTRVEVQIPVGRV
ncbi:MAG TPA: chemotaxis protein CheB [Terriglobia bacterium]|nr:chemotaxis protein CheB [Terriglobia bacterium]